MPLRSDPPLLGWRLYDSRAHLRVEHHVADCGTNQRAHTPPNPEPDQKSQQEPNNGADI